MPSCLRMHAYAQDTWGLTWGMLGLTVMASPALHLTHPPA